MSLFDQAYDPKDTNALMEKYANKNKAWYKNPLSINIMNKKYLHPGETTAVEFINRVCSIFTNDELRFKMRSLLIEGSFFPGGRTLYAAGCKGKFEATASNCFPSYTKVLTSEGIKNIKDVVVGDMVITSQGPHRVNNTFVRDYKGDLIVLESKDFTDEIICTPNHEFLTDNGWISASNLITGSRIRKVNVDPEKEEYAILESISTIKADTTVYNLSVDDVHEYNANGVNVHNCYIQKSVSDSLDSIYESNRQIAKIFKAGGGIGINLSNLRPNGAKTNNAARTSTGAVSFMHIYNATGSVIGFHGRRGATLIGLDISHPDIEEFVELRSKAEMQAMNISCIIDDEFMNAVLKGRQYRLHFHVDATGEDIEKYVDAKKLYHRICEMNWDYGDPGMLFKHAVDTHNLMAYNKNFKIDICNPCAEYTGPEYNSCNLGSMNLYNYVLDKFSNNSRFNYFGFERDVCTAVEALDQILDYGYDLQPLDENRKTIDKWRSIGLGFFGFADALIALGIRYGSAEAKEFAANVCNVLTRGALKESSILGKAYGSFGEFDLDSLLKSPVIHELDNSKMEFSPISEKLKENKALRNAQLISIAPTGSLSLLAGQLSSGIEPIYKCMYERSTHGLEKSGVHFTVADRAVSDLLEYHGIEPGSISTEELKKRFPFIVESDDIDPIDRVETQAAMQRYIDNAISSTVNLPESATVEDIEKIYMKAWESGLKGITIFRNNCKRASILGFSNKKEEKNENESENKVKMDTVEPISRRTKGPLSGRTYRRQTACVKSMYITVNRDEDGNIFEVFTNKSIHGCSANIATITRLTSLALRSGISVKHIIQELKENACQSCQDLIRKGNYDISKSCPYAIGDVLEKEYYIDYDKIINTEEVSNDENQSALKCPECGERTLLVEGKCTTCKSCGYSKCD